MSTIKTTNIQNAGSATTNIALDTNGNATVGGTLAMSGSFARNRLINGDMSVYQRGSVAATTAGAYTLDRWFVTPTGATVTVTQSTSVVPTGFADSLNVAGAASVTNVSVRQRIESVNTQDLASGVQVTVSGRIYQSTGSAVTTATIALAAPTAADNYTSTTSAATTYTLPSIPNATWTTFSNTFTLTTSCVNGLQVTIALGTGLTSGSFNLTGVQLEVGSTATPFERRLYGQELALCQRYLFSMGGTNTYERIGAGLFASTTVCYGFVTFPVQMRTSPSMSFLAGAAFAAYDGVSVYGASAIAADTLGPSTANIYVTVSGGTAFRAGQIITNNTTNARLRFSAEL